MATLLQTLTVPCTASFHSSSTHSAVKLPEVSGLKVRFCSSTRFSLRSVTRRSESTRRVNRFVCESSESTAQLASVTDDTFKSLVLESDLPVLVEFWAPWCGPCRIIQPVIDELSKEFSGKLKVFKVNTDESPTIASDYGVRSIPTVIIFKNGDKKEAIIGAVPKSTLTSSIEKFL